MSNPELGRDTGQGPIGVTRNKQTIQGQRGLVNTVKSSPLLVAQISPVDVKLSGLRPRVASKLIPDLDKAVVDELLDTIRMLKTRKWRQDIIDIMVKNREKKGTRFNIMEGSKPVYLETYPSWVPKEKRPSNGITLHPGQQAVCTGSKPCVFIFPPAFGGMTKEESVVRLYSAIMHEHRHATQWQDPSKAKKLGKMGREFDAFIWEIENQKRTGLSSQPNAKANVWREVEDAWKDFKNSAEWKSMSEEEQRKFIGRYSSAKAAATK